MEQLFKQLEVWFVIGSQHLYGDKILQQVAENAEVVVKGLNAEGNFPIKLVLKPTVTTPEQILALFDGIGQPARHGITGGAQPVGGHAVLPEIVEGHAIAREPLA